MSDYIKVYRKTLDSRVFSDADAYRVFMWCLLKANWKIGWVGGCVIEPGSFATGRDKATDELHIGETKWRNNIAKLTSWGCITTKTTTKMTIITVVNWDQYQAIGPSSFGPKDSGFTASNVMEGEKPPNDHPTKTQRGPSDQPTTNQPPPTIEEGEERKKGRREEKRGASLPPDDWDFTGVEDFDRADVRQALENWVEMRRNKGSRFRLRSRKNASVGFKHYDSPEHLIYACEHATQNEYTGIKPNYRPMNGKAKSCGLVIPDVDLDG